MVMKSRFVRFLSMALLAVASSTMAALDDDRRLTYLTERFEGAESPVPSLAEQADEYGRRFRELWSDSEYAPEGLAKVSDEIVSLRLRAALSTAFANHETWVLERLEQVVAEAHGRELARAPDYRRLFDAHLAAGNLAAANRVRQRYPALELPTVPERVDPAPPDAASRHLVWRIKQDPERLVGDWVSLKRPSLLVVSSPGCGFSRRAATALAEDDTLAPLMDEHAIWIAGPSIGNTFHQLAWWNEHFPAAQKVLADDVSDWPVTDFFQFPQFVFVENDQVTAEHFGWQGGSESLRTIADGFAELGLLNQQDLDKNVFAYSDEAATRTACPTQASAMERIRQTTPISKAEALAEHLAAAEAGADSPLLALTTEARKRFTNSVVFSGNGVAGFRMDDFMVLKPEQRYQVAALFGHQYFLAGSHFPETLLSKDELELRNQFFCTEE